MSGNHEQVAKMLANPLRARILRLLLATETVSVPMLAEVMPDVTREVIGHHMRLLVNAEVIELARRTRRTRGRGSHQFDYRLAVDRDVLRGLLWGQRASVINDGSGRDATAVLDSRGMQDFAALTANFVAALSEIEREAHGRREAAGDCSDAWAVAVLVAKDVELI